MKVLATSLGVKVCGVEVWRTGEVWGVWRLLRSPSDLLSPGRWNTWEVTVTGLPPSLSLHGSSPCAGWDRKVWEQGVVRTEAGGIPWPEYRWCRGRAPGLGRGPPTQGGEEALVGRRGGSRGRERRERRGPPASRQTVSAGRPTCSVSVEGAAWHLLECEGEPPAGGAQVW